MLDEDEIAFLEPLALRELAPRLCDVTDVLVAHDYRCARRRGVVELHVRAADAGDFHLHERRVSRNVRHREFADLGFAGSRPHRCQHPFHIVPQFRRGRQPRGAAQVLSPE
ncbi:MAG TPA: hypothetical protein VED01_11405 [Burkholderiales bacterium]|nr:hypothetical protein [Burkholderiales bacterium]